MPFISHLEETLAETDVLELQDESAVSSYTMMITIRLTT